MDYVVDASVVFKWLLPEAHTSEAENLLSPEVLLLAPDLLYAEIDNVLWKRVSRREISETKANEALRQLMAVEIDITPASFRRRCTEARLHAPQAGLRLHLYRARSPARCRACDRRQAFLERNAGHAACKANDVDRRCHDLRR